LEDYELAAFMAECVTPCVMMRAIERSVEIMGEAARRVSKTEDIPDLIAIIQDLLPPL